VIGRLHTQLGGPSRFGGAVSQVWWAVAWAAYVAGCTAPLTFENRDNIKNEAEHRRAGGSAAFHLDTLLLLLLLASSQQPKTQLADAGFT
jgi:hypothetical protein